MWRIFIVIPFFFWQISAAQSACSGPEYGQFDFWIGKWQVFDANEKKLGESTIEKIQDGCVMLENWKNLSSGYTGTSHSYYDKKDKQWHQVWIDNQGTNSIFAGEWNGEKMVMRTQLTKRDEKEVFSEISWEPQNDGTVIQQWVLFDKDNQKLRQLFWGVYKPHQ